MTEIQTSARAQLDIFDHDPRRLADANRIAADAARVALNFPPAVREERVRHYLAEAERYDALADQCTSAKA
ncbi:hypothetical protein [Stenotrophomonas sp. NLF4-10]|uniref:hypothetical protein n=1 Tax=Stenotrophomonas sp. NLF4-10 TaxID=2918754 RepID=UPI001EFA4D22|nr:hypothetical protein [Stenotrophomonas sp. NLF4-10]MCG8275372.1 hypothetical protein [Stenotrophomonas sp. NLF4-10]